MLAPAGHVTTAAAALLVWYTHAVEYSDGELATDAVRDTVAPRDRETLTDGDTDGDTEGDATLHCTNRRKLVWKPQPPPPDDVSVLGTIEHEARPKHDALTDAPLVEAPGHEPTAKGPDGHDPVGLP